MTQKFRKTFNAILLIFIFLLLLSSAASAQKCFSVGDKVKTLWKNVWHVCTVKEVGDGEYFVHFEDDERIFDRWMSEDKLHNFTYKMGDIILVKKDGQWQPAKVVGAGTLQYKADYQKINADDEWVGPDRIKDLGFSIGERVKVFWNGDWFEAYIESYENGRYLVHYEGFPASYDEWVTIDRIQKL